MRPYSFISNYLQSSGWELDKAFEGEVPAADISQSPTLTEEMTRAGVILGTAAYMSPEQARGKLREPIFLLLEVCFMNC